MNLLRGAINFKNYFSLLMLSQQKILQRGVLSQELKYLGGGGVSSIVPINRPSRVTMQALYSASNKIIWLDLDRVQHDLYRVLVIFLLEYPVCLHSTTDKNLPKFLKTHLKVKMIHDTCLLESSVEPVFYKITKFFFFFSK